MNDLFNRNLLKLFYFSFREHPEQSHLDKEELDDWYESDNQRELRQIFSGQMQIFDVLRNLNQKLDEVVGRQERTLSLISQVQVGGVQVSGGQQSGGQPVQLIDTIRRQEVDAVLSNQNIILSTAREIKTFIGDVNSKAETILHNQARAPTAQVQPMGYDYQSLISEMRDTLNQVKRDIAQSYTKLSGDGQTGNCPTINCLSTTVFLLLLVVQMIIMIGYNIYRDNKGAQAKKFY